jgi:excisionase family DNA binding protein
LLLYHILWATMAPRQRRYDTPEQRRVGGVRVTSRATSQKLTVQEAAEVLGTSVDAVRMRVRRGSLESEKDPDGRVYVWVDSDQSETKPGLNGESTTLISAKDETIRVLSEQLEAEREANRENRRIIAALTQRIPELEAPASPEPSGASDSVFEEPERAEPRSATGSAQEGAERVSWWRRVFGGA